MNDATKFFIQNAIFRGCSALSQQYLSTAELPKNMLWSKAYKAAKTDPGYLKPRLLKIINALTFIKQYVDSSAF